MRGKRRSERKMISPILIDGWENFCQERQNQDRKKIVSPLLPTRPIKITTLKMNIKDGEILGKSLFYSNFVLAFETELLLRPNLGASTYTPDAASHVYVFLCSFALTSPTKNTST